MRVVISRKAAEKLIEFKGVPGLDSETLVEFIENLPEPLLRYFFGDISNVTLISAICSGYKVGYASKSVIVTNDLAQLIKNQYDCGREDYRFGLSDTLHFLGLDEILEVDYDDIT